MNRGQKLPLITALIISTVVAAGLGMGKYRENNPALDWGLRSFSVDSDQKVSVVWEIARQENKDTYCVLRAQDEKRMDVGYATVLIAAGPAKTTMAYQMNTESLAVLVEVLGCAYQPEMRVPPANFPPGVKIPEQVAPGFAPTQ